MRYRVEAEMAMGVPRATVCHPEPTGADDDAVCISVPELAEFTWYTAKLRVLVLVVVVACHQWRCVTQAVVAV
jgi:hypothetical protein